MPNYKNALNVDEVLLVRCEKDRQSLMQCELEAWLVRQCQQKLYKSRCWELDFESTEAYLNSCKPYRQRWSQTIGEFSFTSELNADYEPFFEDEVSLARWLYIDLDKGLRGRAALALPKKASEPLPLVIAVHGYVCSPEIVFGFRDPNRLYHAYGRALLKAGYAVLAPDYVINTGPMVRLNRLCLLLGKTLHGLNIGQFRRFLDHVEGLQEIDTKRIGMWGISNGALYTMFTPPLEPRIKTAIITAFFNSRFHKMAISSPFYSCFLDTEEEYMWIPGWFSEGFSDAELLALICPRPVQIQQGRADGIGWWPQQHREFDRARQYYSKLGITEHIEYVDHQGGHEILVDEGLSFLKKWL